MSDGNEAAWMVVILIVLPVVVGGLVSVLARSRGHRDEDRPDGHGSGPS